MLNKACTNSPAIRMSACPLAVAAELQAACASGVLLQQLPYVWLLVEHKTARVSTYTSQHMYCSAFTTCRAVQSSQNDAPLIRSCLCCCALSTDAGDGRSQRKLLPSLKQKGMLLLMVKRHHCSKPIHACQLKVRRARGWKSGLCWTMGC